MLEQSGDPLAGLRVLDCAGASGAYCGRLLADLGADVILVEPPGGGPARGHEPVVAHGEARVGCFDRFVNLNKRSVTVPFGTKEGRDAFLELVASTDVLIDSYDGPPGSVHGLNDEELRRKRPDLVRVVITSFGLHGPSAGAHSDDLTTLAAGGLLSLGGYEDTGPVAVRGEQTYFARSIFGAAAVLLALIERDGTGQGDTVEVCAQEVVANALEDAVPDYDLNGRVRVRRGEHPREAGTGTYRCGDGYVAVVAGRIGTAKAFEALATWMIESGTQGAEELREPHWTQHRFRQSPEGMERFRELFERFASHFTKADLYEEAQRRSIALAPVNSPGEVLEDVQLAARGFFNDITDGGLSLRYPGRPFAIDGLGPFLRRPVPFPGQHNAELLAGLDPFPGLPAAGDGVAKRAALTDGSSAEVAGARDGRSELR